MRSELRKLVRDGRLALPPKSRLLRAVCGRYAIRRDDKKELIAEVVGEALPWPVVESLVEKFLSLKNPPKLSRFVARETEKLYWQSVDSNPEMEKYGISRNKQTEIFVRRSVEACSKKIAEISAPQDFVISSDYSDLYRGVVSTYWKSCLSYAYHATHFKLIDDPYVGIGYTVGNHCTMAHRFWVVVVPGVPCIAVFGFQAPDNKMYTERFAIDVAKSISKKFGIGVCLDYPGRLFSQDEWTMKAIEFAMPKSVLLHPDCTFSSCRRKYNVYFPKKEYENANK